MNKLLLIFAIFAFPSMSMTQEPRRIDTQKIYTEFNEYIGQYGQDKQLHFSASYGLVYFNANPDIYLIGGTTEGKLLALKRGLIKEMDDIGISPTNRSRIIINNEIEKMRYSNVVLWQEIRHLKLDEGDLLADYAGGCLAEAILSMQQYILIDTSTNKVDN